jgi:hypothetical protein
MDMAQYANALLKQYAQQTIVDAMIKMQKAAAQTAAQQTTAK